MLKSAYHAPSHQMATPSASSAHRPSGGRARGGKALSMRSSVYSSQSSAALTSQPIDINVIDVSSNNGKEAVGENLDVDLEKELGM